MQSVFFGNPRGVPPIAMGLGLRPARENLAQLLIRWALAGYSAAGQHMVDGGSCGCGSKIPEKEP